MENKPVKRWKYTDSDDPYFYHPKCKVEECKIPSKSPLYDNEYTYCKVHMCENSPCPDLKLEGSKYCSEHSCGRCFPGSKGRICSKHCCQEWSCNKPYNKPYIFCPKHNCIVKDCMYQKYCSQYCHIHRCQNCKNKKLDNERYCQGCKCEKCSYPSVGFIRYCYMHMCPFQNHICYNPRGNNYLGLCESHKDIWKPPC